MSLQRSIALIVAVVASAVVVTSLSLALLVSNRTVPNSGNISAVGVLVYWDSSCTNQTTSINWYTVDPGAAKSYTVYIKNNGTSPERLSMTTTTWDPSTAQNYLNLTWNRNNYLLNEGASVSATLTLTVSSSITNVEDFHFNIIITGTQQA